MKALAVLVAIAFWAAPGSAVDTTGGAPAGSGDCVADCRCAGDCDFDDRVTVGELICGVGTALDREGSSLCPCFDLNGDDSVAVSELIRGVGRALRGCQRPLVMRYPGAKFPTVPARSIDAVDLDGDGILDIVTVGFIGQLGLHSVSVQMGQLHGTFALPQMFPVGGFSPLAFAVADLNEDGLLDAATANALSDDLSVLFGRGDGTFDAPVLFPAGLSPRSVTAGDVNGDGRLDLIAANQDSDDVGVLLGEGGGRFGDLQLFHVGGVSPRGVTVADVNSDGRDDVLTVNASSWDLSVMLGNADGTISPPRVYSVGAGPFFMAVSDFNLDGSADLVAANAFAGDLTVLLGSGDGDFAALPPIPTGLENFAIRVADLNKDGVPDLVAAYGLDTGVVETMLGRGDGTFDRAQQSESGAGVVAIAVADIDRDGWPDVITDDGVVLLGLGNGGFRVPESVAKEVLAMAVADFDGDSRLDLAVTEIGHFAVRLGLGDGTFSEPLRSAAGASGLRMAVADLDSDGRLDIVTSNFRPASAASPFDDFSVFIGRGDGTFEAPRHFSGGTGEIGSIAVADFDGDGRPDVVAAVTGDTRLAMLTGNGDGTLNASRLTQHPGGHGEITAADLDVDGHQDLVVTGGGIARVLEGNGDGSFTEGQVIVFHRGPGPVVITDMTDDGHLDLVAAEGGNTGNHVVVLSGKGDGTFTQVGRFPTGQELLPTEPRFVAVADVDGDSVADVVAANERSQDIVILLGMGDGRLGPPQAFAAGAKPSSLVIEDLNRDGQNDLVVSSTGIFRSPSIFLMLAENDRGS